MTSPLHQAAREAIEALEKIARRLQMDIDDGGRPDQWSMEDLVRVAAGPIAALTAALQAQQQQGQEPPTDSFVQPVPDHCDRITWRNHYYHLPVTSSSRPAAEMPAGDLHAAIKVDQQPPENKAFWDGVQWAQTGLHAAILNLPVKPYDGTD